MTLHRTRHLFAALVLSASTTTLSASGPAPGANVPHRGTTTATSYSNDFFNVAVNFPENWTAMTDDELLGIPNEFIAGPVQALSRGVPLESLPQFPLVVLMKTDGGAEAQGAANIMVLALSLRGGTAAAIPLVAAQVRAGAMAARGVKTVSPIYSEILGGKTFRRFDGVVSNGPGRHDLKQHWYLAESRGFAILVLTTAGTVEEENAVAAVMNSFTFARGSSVAAR
jgi:hypothetical protein